MLSLIKTFPFSFTKRSFIIGFIILLFGTLASFSLFGLGIHLAKQGIQPSSELKITLNIIGYLIKLLGYSALFSFVFIRAKQDAYDLPTKNPSNEFLMRIFVTIFGAQLLTDIMLLLCAVGSITVYYYTKNITLLLISFATLLILITYILYNFWTSYVMNFNFSRFGYKFIQSLKKPLLYLQVLGLSILYILIISAPVILVAIFHDNVVSGLNPFRQSPSMGFYIITILLGIFLGFFYSVFKTGRLLGVLYTILFLITFGLTKCILNSIIPIKISFPLTGVLSAYCWISVMYFIATIMSVIIPTGIVHLISQAAYQIHKTFDPSIEKQKEPEIILQPSEQDPNDGWLR